MRLDVNAIADVVVREAEGKTKTQITSMMKDLVRFLAEHGMLGRWQQLERAIDRAWAKHYGVANVTVLSAHPLTTAARKALEERAKGADIREIVDERLIAGAVIRMDNLRVDGSVTGALMRLKNAMYSEV